MKDQLKREIASLLPEDTSTDIIVRLATYVEGKMGEEGIGELIKKLPEIIRLQSYYDGNNLMWQADDSGNFMIKDDQKAGVGSTPKEALENLLTHLKQNGE